MKTDAFRDQVIIVTGASAGIGKSLALLLASQGARGWWQRGGRSDWRRNVVPSSAGDR